MKGRQNQLGFSPGTSTHPSSVHATLLLTLSSLLTAAKGSRLMACWHFCKNAWQQHGSWQAAWGRPATSRQPARSRSDLKETETTAGFLTMCHVSSLFSPSALFYYREQDGKHCPSREKRGEEAVKPALTIGTTVTTRLDEMTTHESKLWWSGDHSKQMCKQ